MKKTLKTILIMLAVLLVLGGAVAALLLTAPKTEETDPASDVSTPEVVKIMDRDVADVQSVTVKNSADEYTFLPQGEEFTLKGYEDCAVNTITTTSNVKQLLVLTSNRDLGAQKDLAEYGLTGDAASTVEITYKDGTTDTLVLGGTAGETSGRYVLKDGSVHIVPGVPEPLYGKVFGYFSTALYTVANLKETVVDDDGWEYEQDTEDVLYYLRLSGTDYPDGVEIVRDDSLFSSYRINTPIMAEAGQTKMETLMEELRSLTANEVAAVHLSPELLKEYGLDEPAAKVEFHFNDSEHTLTASKAGSDGIRYLTLDDIDTIYAVSADKIACWADLDLQALRLSYIWAPNINDVEKFWVVFGGGTLPNSQYYLTQTRTVNEEKSTEDKTEYDYAITGTAGDPIEYKTYQSLYSDVIGITVFSLEKPEYSKIGFPAYSVTYKFFDYINNFPIEVTFWPVGEDRYAAELNGEFNGLVRKSQVDKAFAQLREIDPNSDNAFKVSAKA